MSINFEQMRLEERKKNVILAYVLWWFFGFFGAHRFYLGKSSAVIMLIITILSFVTIFMYIGYIGLLVMFAWWIFDAILLHRWVNSYNLELINNYEKTMNS